MKGANTLMVALVTFMMMMVGLFIVSFFMKPMKKIDCGLNSDCSINCTRMFPEQKCKDGKCVCVASCLSNASCSYLGTDYICIDQECIK